MSSSEIRTFPFAVSSASREAAEKCATKLPEEAWLKFRDSGPEDIIYDMERMRGTRHQTEELICFIRRVQLVTEPVEWFSSHGLSQQTGKSSSPIWGLVRLALTTAGSSRKSANKFVDVLGRLTDVLPRFRGSRKLYSRSPDLLHALSTVYLRVVDFLLKPRNWAPGSRQESEGRIKQSLKPICILTDLVERETRLANMIELEDPNPEASWERRASEEYLNTAGKMNNTMAPFQQRHDLALRHIGNWLGVHDCDTDIDRFRLQPHTADWVLQHPEVVRWKREPKTQLLWITGPPGCGKTHAYVTLLRHLGFEDFRRFFFDRTDNSRTLTDALLRSWIYQLVAIPSSNSSQAMRLAWARQRIGATRVATKEQVRDLFTSLLKVVAACCFTADGIDECVDRVELRKILDIIPRRFKILLVGRPLPDLVNYVQRWTFDEAASLTMAPDLFGKSLGCYIRYQLNDLPGDRSAEQLGRTQGCLEGSHATFLWVRLAMQRLRRSNAKEDTVEMVKNLSDDVNGIYDEILAEVNASPHDDQQMAYAVFFWILSARRLLTLDELLTLLAVRLSSSAGEEEEEEEEEEEDDDDESAYYVPIRSENPQKLIESITGGLVVCGDNGQAVCFIHSTAAERLNKQRVLSMAAEYHKAPPLFPHNSIAAAVCMRYLSLNILAAEASPTGSGLELADVVRLSSPASGVLGALVYAAEHWFLHARKAGDMDATTLRIGARFLDRGRPNMELSWRVYWFAHGGIHPGAQLPRGFSSLHLTTYFGLTALFLHLLPDVPATSIDSNGASVLWWAASLGRIEFVEQLLEHGADPHQPDAYRITPVHRAAMAGKHEIVRALLTTDEARKCLRADARGWTMIHSAAAAGQPDCLSAVWGSPMERRTTNAPHETCAMRHSRTDRGRAAIHLAALHGVCNEILGRLTSSSYRSGPTHWETLNLVDSAGQTALHLAACQGHDRIIKYLCTVGADWTIQDAAGKTAYDRALEAGCSQAAATLAEQPALYQITGNNGRTFDGQRLALAMERAWKFKVRMFKPQGEESEDEGAASTSEVRDEYKDHADFVRRIQVEIDETLSAVMNGEIHPLATDSSGRTMLHHSVIVERDYFMEVLLERDGRREEEHRAVLDAQDDRGWTALHYAATGRTPSVIQTLVSAGVPADARGLQGETAFDVAMAHGTPDVIEAFLRHVPTMPSAEIAEKLGWNEWHRRARDGEVTNADVDAIAATRSQLGQRDRLGRVPAFRAAEARHWDAVRILCDETQSQDLTPRDILEIATKLAESEDATRHLLPSLLARLPPFCLDREGILAHGQAQLLLVAAAGRGSYYHDNGYNALTCVKALVRAGVRLETEGMVGKRMRASPLLAALDANSLHAVSFLMRSGADVNWPSAGAPIPLAIMRARPECARVLLRHGGDGGRQAFYDSWPVANLLFRWGREGGEPSQRAETQHLTDVLLAHGAAVFARPTSLGWMAVYLSHVASLKGEAPLWEKDMASSLGAEGHERLLEAPDEDGNAPIHTAILAGDVEAVQRELDAGVPVDWAVFRQKTQPVDGDVFNHMRQTPLRLAVDRDDVAVAALLLRYGADPEEFVGPAPVLPMYPLSGEMREFLEGSLAPRELL